MNQLTSEDSNVSATHQPEPLITSGDDLSVSNEKKNGDDSDDSDDTINEEVEKSLFSHITPLLSANNSVDNRSIHSSANIMSNNSPTTSNKRPFENNTNSQEQGMMNQSIWQIGINQNESNYPKPDDNFSSQIENKKLKPSVPSSSGQTLSPPVNILPKQGHTGRVDGKLNAMSELEEPDMSCWGNTVLEFEVSRAVVSKVATEAINTYLKGKTSGQQSNTTLPHVLKETSTPSEEINQLAPTNTGSNLDQNEFTEAMMSRQVKIGLARAAGLFIYHVTGSAVQAAQESGRNLINAEDMKIALKELGFADLC